MSLLSTTAVLDPVSGAEVIPAYPSGAKTLIQCLLDLHYLDDQDLAWTSLDKFFTFVRPSDMDFGTYVTEWNRLFDEAAMHGQLQVGETGKCWLFFSRSGITDRDFRDLRLKVNGGLTRFQEMIGLHLKIRKNDEATHDQNQGYKQYQTQHDEWWDSGYYDEWGSWTHYEDLEYEHEDYYDDYNDEYDYDDDYDAEDVEADTKDYYGGKGKTGQFREK